MCGFVEKHDEDETPAAVPQEFDFELHEGFKDLPDLSVNDRGVYDDIEEVPAAPSSDIADMLQQMLGKVIESVEVKTVSIDNQGDAHKTFAEAIKQGFKPTKPRIFFPNPDSPIKDELTDAWGEYFIVDLMTGPDGHKMLFSVRDNGNMWGEDNPYVANRMIGEISGMEHAGAIRSEEYEPAV